MESISNGADEYQQTGTNSNTNVRSKVSVWVSNFVSEMKTKSPAVVQRWVDSLPHEKFADIVNETQNHTFDDLDSNKSETLSDQITHDSPIQLLRSKEIPNECNSNTITSANDFKPNITQSTNSDNISGDKRFWQRRPSILSALRQNKSQSIETDDLTRAGQSSSRPDRPNEPIQIRIDSISFDEPSTSIATTTAIADTTITITTTATTTTTAATAAAAAAATITTTTATTTNSKLLAKTKLTELYDKFGISKKRYNYFKERKMEAKKILSNAKSRFLASTTIQNDSCNDQENNLLEATDENAENDIICAESSDTNAVGMDISTDELSHLSHCNDLLLVDDANDNRPLDDEDDSFNISMPSINDGSTSQLSTSRRIVMADIGRSTSDNPRLRNKFYLGDIGRSFSENQDDDTILIGERNISAPSSSIAIQNNNRPSSALYERRAYSVSPTHRSLKRGTLSREQSLSDSSRHRHQLSKGSSFQSDSSHCSSVESLLDARKPDPEAILRQLGFGPAYQESLLSRIPQRFLKPSQVQGIDTEAFMRQQHVATNIHEQSILGYRGLIGNPHVLPSVIVAKLMERFRISDERTTRTDFDVLKDIQSLPDTPLSPISPKSLADLQNNEPT